MGQELQHRALHCSKHYRELMKTDLDLKILEEELTTLFKNVNDTSALDTSIRDLEAQLRTNMTL
mgnify:CR=1 FL=1